MFIYTGIGSRNCDMRTRKMLSYCAEWISSNHKCVLRSGAADGADSAFEFGHSKGFNEKEIYIPWYNFNNYTKQPIIVGQNQLCMDIAKSIHPAWNLCSYKAKLLHSRNICQILGKDPKNPVLSDFVLAYTENGELKGGTRTALVLAGLYNIPIFNFGAYSNFSEEIVFDFFLDFFYNLDLKETRE